MSRREIEEGSIRETVPSPAFVTQIDPSPQAIALVWRPTVGVATGPLSKVAGLKRYTVASPPFATQTDLSAYTIPVGPLPANPRPETRPLEGLMRTRVELPKTAQTEPPPTATELDSER